VTSLAALSRTTVPSEKLILKEVPTVTGIVHIGLGNFHRAHLAVYTAIAMQKSGGNWGVCAYSLRNTKLVSAMRAQDNLYSVVEIGPDTDSIVIPGIHTRSLVGQGDIAELITMISSPDTKIISLTVTEAGYYISQRTHGLDLAHEDITHDLLSEDPRTMYGILRQGLDLRIKNGASPITILSCDNISENGNKTASLLKEFVALRKDSALLLEFLSSSVTFPNSMVDRIVPGSELRHQDMAAQRLGLADSIPIPAEKFSMWAIEDNFAAGRPSWEDAGAIFTTEVEKFEVMKLRLLNGAHSLLAYLGALRGCETIPAARFDELIVQALTKVLYEEYLPSFEMPSGLSAESYIEELFSRWSNTALGDKSARVGSDGSTKLPQRITIPALVAMKKGQEPRLLAITVAAWLMCLAPFKDFTPSEIARAMKDPAKEKLIALTAGAEDIHGYVQRFFNESGIFSTELYCSHIFTNLVEKYVGAIYSHGIEDAIREAVK